MTEASVHPYDDLKQFAGYTADDARRLAALWPHVEKRLGEVVEHARTTDLFLSPADPRTAEYIEGRYA